MTDEPREILVVKSIEITDVDPLAMLVCQEEIRYEDARDGRRYTFNVMDEQGRPMSMEEWRRRLLQRTVDDEFVEPPPLILP